MLKTIRPRRHRRFTFCWLLVILLLPLALVVPIHAADSQAPFENLQKRLIADGFDSDRIQAIFASPDVSFEKGGVSAYFMHNESKLNYKQFTRIWNISSAKKYMQTHQEALDAAQQTFEVDKEVITAIILVETKLGTFTGKRSVMNTLSTLSAMADDEQRQAIWDNLPDNDRRMSREKFEKKADRKSSWAYRELKAFLTYTENQGMDPTTIKGSYAGAMGISQFMPSNALTLARDGNQDGRIDLFDHADANNQRFRNKKDTVSSGMLLLANA